MHIGTTCNNRTSLAVGSDWSSGDCATVRAFLHVDLEFEEASLSLLLDSRVGQGFHMYVFHIVSPSDNGCLAVLIHVVLVRVVY